MLHFCLYEGFVEHINNERQILAFIVCRKDDGIQHLEARSDGAGGRDRCRMGFLNEPHLKRHDDKKTKKDNANLRRAVYSYLWQRVVGMQDQSRRVESHACTLLPAPGGPSEESSRRVESRESRGESRESTPDPDP
mmetsp:Transcript_19913/g.57190  ORF Transcript_19913/g.57190 Transcript_19913/m.57190 type:complete len:136 (+) Transcript_19913:941-1348(+)